MPSRGRCVRRRASRCGLRHTRGTRHASTDSTRDARRDGAPPAGPSQGYAFGVACFIDYLLYCALDSPLSGSCTDGRNDEWTVKDNLCSAYAQLAGGAQQHSMRVLQPLPRTGDLENVRRMPVVALKTRLQRSAEYVWEAFEEVGNWWEPVNNIAHALKLLRTPKH